MVFETQSTTVSAKAADPSRRLALGSCLGFVTAFFGWRIIRRYLARPTTKKVYTPGLHSPHIGSARPSYGH